jgi:hypothetical protein
MLIDTKVTEYPVTKAWEKGNEELKNGNRDEARDYFDLGIAYVAQLSMDEGLGDRDKIEGKTRKLWLTRFWKVGLGNNDLLL